MTNAITWAVLGVLLCVVAVVLGMRRRIHEEAFGAPAGAPADPWARTCQIARESGFHDRFLATTSDLPETCRPALETWLATRDVEASRKMLEETCLSSERRLQFFALLVLEHLREWMMADRLGVGAFCKRLTATIERMPNPDARSFLVQFQESCRAQEGGPVSDACAISYRRWAYDGTPLPSGCSQEALLEQIDRLFQQAASLRGEALAAFCAAVQQWAREVQAPEVRSWLESRAPCQLSQREAAFQAWYGTFEKAVAAAGLQIAGKAAATEWRKAYDRREVVRLCRWDKEAAAAAGAGTPSAASPAAASGGAPSSAAARGGRVLERLGSAPPTFVRVVSAEDRTLAWTATASGAVELRKVGPFPTQFWILRGSELLSAALPAALSMDPASRAIVLQPRGASARPRELTIDAPTKTIFFRTAPMLSVEAPRNAFQQLAEGIALRGAEKGSAWEVVRVDEPREVLLLLGDDTRRSSQPVHRVPGPEESLWGVAQSEVSFSGWLYFDADPETALVRADQVVPIWRWRSEDAREPASLALVVRVTPRAYQIGLRRLRGGTTETEIWSTRLEILPRQWHHVSVHLAADRTLRFALQGEVLETVPLGDADDAPLVVAGGSRLLWELWPTDLVVGSARGWIARTGPVTAADHRVDLARYSPILVGQLVPQDVVARREDHGVVLPMGDPSQPQNALLHHPIGWTWPRALELPEGPVYLEYRFPNLARIRRILLQGVGLAYPTRWRASYLDPEANVFVPLPEVGDWRGPAHEKDTVVQELPLPVTTGVVRIHLLAWQLRPSVRTGFHGDVLVPLRPTPPTVPSSTIVTGPGASQTVLRVAAGVAPAAAAIAAAPPPTGSGRCPAAATAGAGATTEAGVVEVCKHLGQVQPERYGDLRECVQAMYQRLAQST